ncbi:MAG: hypothetical protein KZQ88_02755 [Candidatus Thiodiazotropha sp. (ex Dulcina madagascariensis)]|nr:hypothetical protein [Candidatus Thiodiazotropha sp. (ex Dulcina madagascariensis)]MCU7926905.1 hypothetical protein [Candidatus Thiodiazotropha sp. (ex Dulcina madagascariensis)]
MKRNVKFKLPCYLGLVLLLSTMSVKGEMVENTDSPTKNILVPNNIADDQPISDININHIATEALVDTESEFEAILYDYQSQETIGHLYWNQNDSVGKIEFEYGGIKDQVSIQISNLEAMESSERYDTLLRGLHEAGIAWISQQKIKSPLMVSSTMQQEPSSLFKPMLLQPIGYFDEIRPQILSNTFFPLPPSGITRYAHGWAYDPDRSSQSIWVHFYGETESEPPKYIGAVLANLSRPDVNRKGIAGQHGWKVKVPEAWDADLYHDAKGVCRESLLGYPKIKTTTCFVKFYAYGIDLTGDGHRQLVNSPYWINAIKYHRP